MLGPGQVGMAVVTGRAGQQTGQGGAGRLQTLIRIDFNYNELNNNLHIYTCWLE